MDKERSNVVDVVAILLVIAFAYKIGEKKGYYDSTKDIIRAMELCDNSQK